MRINVSGHHEIARELVSASEEARPKVEKVISKGALNIKRDMRRDAKSDGSYQHFHRSITYDLEGLTAEIGPDKSKVQGALGNILYFGTSKNAPVLNLNGPLNREEPRFFRAIDRVNRELLP